MGKKLAARMVNGQLRDTAREYERLAKRARESGDAAQAEHLDKLALVARLIAEGAGECPDCEGRGCADCTGVEAE